MKNPSSSVSTVQSFDNDFVNYTWSALLELLVHEEVSSTFEPVLMKLIWLSICQLEARVQSWTRRCLRKGSRRLVACQLTKRSS